MSNKTKKTNIKHSPKSKIDTLPLNNKKNLKFYYLIGILLLTFIVFSKTLNNDILTNWDDEYYILNNNVIKNTDGNLIGKSFGSFYFSNYHPLTLIVYAMEYKMFKTTKDGITELNAKGFHFVNLMLHLFNLLLVFWLILLLTKRMEAAIFVSAMFALHPLHVESVAWLSELKDVLFSFFFLASLITYIYYLKSDKKEKKYYYYCLILFLMSLLSKSAAIPLPFVLLLIDYYYKKPLKINLQYEKIPFFILSFIFGLLAYYAQKGGGGINYNLDFTLNYNNVDKIFLPFYAVLYYIANLFFPYKLASIHFFPMKVDGMLPIAYYIAPIVLAAIVIIVYKSKKFRSELIFGLLFYFSTIFLVIQIVPIGRAIVAERYSYIPYIGLFLIIAQIYIYIKDSAKLRKYKNLLVGIFVVYILCFSYISFERNKVWKNGVTLFTDLIEKYPERFLGYYNRGGAYKDIAQQKSAEANATNNEEKKAESMQYFQMAIEDFRKAIEKDTNFFDAYNNCGLANTILGNNKQAIDDFTKAIHFYNKSAEKNNFIYMFYYNRGSSKLNLTDTLGAIEDFTASINENSRFANAYLDRGYLKIMLKDNNGAMIDINKSIEINPALPEAYFNRGMLKLNFNDREGACNDFYKAKDLGLGNVRRFIKEFCKDTNF